MKILFHLPTWVELVIQNLFVETDFHQSMYSCPLVSSILLLQAWPGEDCGHVNYWNLYEMTMIEFDFLWCAHFSSQAVVYKTCLLNKSELVNAYYNI